MLRSRLEFAFVLFIVFVSSALSVSFGDFCSHDFICQQPLVCSNDSQCMCPTDTSFWSSRQNSCLSCPSGWTEWKEEKCVLFVAPSPDGVMHEEARNICSTQSAELLKIADAEGFVEFENEMKDLYFAESAHVDREHTHEKHQERIFDVIGGLVSNLLFPTPATPAPTQAPQLIYVTNPTQQILPQSSKSNGTIIIIIAVVVVTILILILFCCCCCGGGFLLWKNDRSSNPPVKPSPSRQRRGRTSLDSTASDGTY
ncbi:unnamed protein product [Adineta ricciae]|uniref:C-type lectin domain-containing protein n=1 Tax=Adineta ricciae TaxID=249248 RepID=A0A814M3U3_ADIRI|nr:unnamed protein product [Adineta ricciae]